MKIRSIYVASGIGQVEWVRHVQQMIQDSGREIAYDWTAHGDVTGQGEERMRQVAQKEIAAVKAADALVVLLPGGKGTHWECGVASALDKPIIMIADSRTVRRTDSAFYCAPTIHWHEGNDPQEYPDAVSSVLFNVLSLLEASPT